MESNFLHSDLTKRIIGCTYDVRNELGTGFLEKVYENALIFELQQQGLRVQQQHPITVSYRGKAVGEYYADLLVEDTVIVELKVVDKLASVHENQLLNYLRATGKQVGLLINFGDKFEVKRRVLQSARR